MDARSDYENVTLLKKTSNTHSEEKKTLVLEAKTGRNSVYENVNPSKSKGRSNSLDDSSTYGVDSLCSTSGQEYVAGSKCYKEDGIEGNEFYTSLGAHGYSQTEGQQLYTELKNGVDNDDVQQISPERTGKNGENYSEENEAYLEKPFVVTVLETELAKRCSLEGKKVLLINTHEIILKDLAPGKKITTFPVFVIRKFRLRKNEFGFEVGTQFPTGEGFMWVKINSYDRKYIQAAINFISPKNRANPVLSSSGRQEAVVETTSNKADGVEVEQAAYQGHQFAVDVCETELANRCGLEGKKLLLINSRGIILKDLAPGESMTTFSIFVVRKFKWRRGDFGFEVGSKFPTGEGFIWVKTESKDRKNIQSATSFFSRK